jgi:hypothetical protein
MRVLRTWLLLCCAPVLAQDDLEFFQPHGVQIEVTRNGSLWELEYRFDKIAEAWLFPRTSPTRIGDDAWRERTWRIETPGVRIVRRGSFDVLVANRGGVPARVKLAFTPLTEKLADDAAQRARGGRPAQ